VPHRPEDLTAAEAAFAAAHPDFDPDGSFAELRRAEYGRLDEGGHTYLDYTGGGLHAAGQVAAHAELLRTQVLGNPHSLSPTSRAATELVEEARAAALAFFGADPARYHCIFTANASGALHLLGESYRFTPASTYALCVDDHNSVNGIREFARAKGARLATVPVIPPELRLDRDAARAVLASAERGARNLFAFPAQSNFSGVQHPLELVAEAQAAGWDVLLDAAAFVPTNRLDLSAVPADFVVASFYKVFGFPTGIGCLLLRRDRRDALARPWFAGGTVTIASVQADAHHLRPDEAAFEDGTVDYLNLPAVTIGLRHVEAVGRDAIHRRVVALTGWLLEHLGALRHAGGEPLVQVLGPTGGRERGGTITFVVRDRDGRTVDDQRLEELAGAQRISFRTGCFCNPGAGEVAHGLRAADLAPFFAGDAPTSFEELRDELFARHHVLVAAVRVSVGIATTFADVHRLVGFLEGFLDRSVEEIAAPGFDPDAVDAAAP
jgi:selenocysteine lyase/cysteine desulfurase